MNTNVHKCCSRTFSGTFPASYPSKVSGKVSAARKSPEKLTKKIISEKSLWFLAEVKGGRWVNVSYELVVVNVRVKVPQ